MLHIANPIYDSVFKYLMEDERIAKTLLSAASDTQVRHSMNIEEEISTALENRDTEIMVYKNEATKAKKIIEKQSEQLNKQSEQLATAIRMLHSNGMTDEMIATSLNVDIEEVSRMLADCKRTF